MVHPSRVLSTDRNAIRSRVAQRMAQRTAYEHCFSAWIYCLKHRDLDAAGIVYQAMKQVESERNRWDS
jgi:hypothetical protein